MLPFLILILFSSACSSSTESTLPTALEPAPAPQTGSNFPTIHPIPTDSQIDAVSHTEIQYLPVHTDLTTAPQIDISLPGKPVWIAGIPLDDASAWAVAFEDGSLQAYTIEDGGYAKTVITPDHLPPGNPLSIYFQDGEIFALNPPGRDASPYSPAIFFDTDYSNIAYINSNGDLTISQNDHEMRLPVNALPDSRILADHRGRLIFLSNPSRIYAHGVLGDEVEATGITLVETNPEVSVLQTISVPKDDVIEGIYPIWADLNQDGESEIIVTLSNAQNGARIVAYREDGTLLAEGSAIGTGFRWRHQLIVAPFGASGENLLAVVRTPHIGGVVEFYRLSGDRFEIVTEIPGISTHIIGSRNLFTAQAGDFDNDGQVEFLAPDQSHTRLGIIGIDGIAVPWIELEAELVTNLSVVNYLDSDKIVLAAGLSNNTLRFWLP